MASNSILKLQVDDKQYEASLKSAQQGLTALQAALRNSGKSFADVDKQTEQYVRELGKMEATAKTTRGRIGEMSSSFVELSRIEKQLTDQERQSPVGKALTESLAQLKQRTIDAKNELQGLENQIKNVGEVKLPDTGGLFGGGKLDGMLQVFGGNLMTKAAGMGVGLVTEMTDAVKQGIELAKAGEGIRIAFERLGRGDILDGLRQATHGTVTDLELMKAAVKFNDFKLPLDELGTMLAFAQQKAKDTGQSVDYMVDSIVTGLGRKSLMILDNLGLSATEVKEKMKQTGDMTKAVGAIIREQMSKAGDYVETAADRAAQANVSLQNKMEELGRKFAPLEEASNNFWTSMKIGILDVVGGPLARLLNGLTEAGRMMNAYGKMGGSGKVGRMTANLAGASEGNRQSIYQQQQAKIWDYINRRENYMKDRQRWVNGGGQNEDLRQSLIAQAKSFGTSNVNDIKAQIDAAKKMLADYQAAAKQILQPIEQKIVPTVGDRGSGGKGGRSGGGSGANKEITWAADSIKAQEVLVSDLRKKWNEAGAGVRDEYLAQLIEAEKKLKEMNDAEGMKRERMQGRLLLKPEDIMMPDTSNMNLAINDTLDKIRDYAKKNPVIIPITTVNDDIKKLTKTARMAAGVVGSIGDAFNAIEDPAAKVAGTVAQAIASIALGFAQAASAKDTTASGWAWLAWLGAGTAALATTIATVHSLTGYAEGGVVKGNHYSGDMLDGGSFGINAGELVLNRAQQGSLASQLEGGGLRNLRLSAEVQGEKIVLVANRYFRRTGQGEIVTWK